MATITTRILTGGNNNHQESSYSFNALATDFISPGVVGAIALNTGTGGTGAYAVNAESTPTMQVRVNQGALYATVIPTGSLSQNIRVDMNAFQDVTITSQGAGAHYAWLYMNVDPALSTNPDANAQTVSTLVVSYSTSSSVDNGTPALYGVLLSVINISSSPVSIVNSNITDKRVVSGTNSITPTAIPANAVTFANLLTTIYGGQVQTLANTATAGGTMYYINLGGIKLLWGTTATIINAASSSTSYGIALPASFFTTLQQTSFTISQATASVSGNFVIGNIQLPTALQFYMVNTTAAAGVGGIVSYFVIGT